MNITQNAQNAQTIAHSLYSMYEKDNTLLSWCMEMMDSLLKKYNNVKYNLPNNINYLEQLLHYVLLFPYFY